MWKKTYNTGKQIGGKSTSINANFNSINTTKIPNIKEDVDTPSFDITSLGGGNNQKFSLKDLAKRGELADETGLENFPQFQMPRGPKHISNLSKRMSSKTNWFGKDKRESSQLFANPFEYKSEVFINGLDNQIGVQNFPNMLHQPSLVRPLSRLPAGGLNSLQPIRPVMQASELMNRQFKKPIYGESIIETSD